EGGSVDALVVYGCNPAYSWIRPEAFRNALAKVKTSVCFNLTADETSSRCTAQAPDHHYLESWNDLSPFDGRTDIVQPTITPLYNTRAAQESLLAWSDNPSTWYDYLRTNHNPGYVPAMMRSDDNWNIAVHNGTKSALNAIEAAALVLVSTATAQAAPAAEVAPAAEAAPVVTTAAAPRGDVSDAVAAVNAVKGGEWELSLYQKVTMGAGQHASNPYLQETPDPMTKVTWDNYITMSPVDVEKLKLSNYIGQCDCANVAKVTVGGVTVSLPVFPAPGQMPGTIGIALGYGRGDGGEAIGNAAYQTGRKGDHLTEGEGKKMTVGRNAYPLASLAGGIVAYQSFSASIEATTEEYPLAATQIHNTVMGRTSVVRETDIATYLGEKDKARGTASYNQMATLSVHEDVNGDGEMNAKDRKPVRDFDLWQEHPVENVGHRWGMTIDLTSCIGCGSCITACHTENNVPVVGKDEVLRHRDMHWMRIDRYYTSDFATVEETSENKKLGTIAAYRDMERPELNPQTVHMPMFCQHCNHAPCETVCPVAATVHSNEGLNNMAYNRCIGTRYCANNCPYKVRRFNWFNYVTNDKFAMFNPAQDDVMRMVLNPDVTVRTRGVMEKCSMCQQRIQGAKVAAKNAGKSVADDPKLTACAEACPTHAITFGDLNDTDSLVRKTSADVRAYYALEEVGAQPNISYMTKVRNTSETTA
ncbi:MAG: 4Fe-4S dicluster domain-containing protein, partial [Flavobacteriales bacterium]|nr:4Fe-4S dicluster domain-containing protein [Flavobacteriales bacterium]